MTRLRLTGARVPRNSKMSSSGTVGFEAIRRKLRYSSSIIRFCGNCRCSAKTYYANGLHNNVCIVIPEWQMVIARTNGGGKDGSANTPAKVDEIWSGFFNRLGEAIALPEL